MKGPAIFAALVTSALSLIAILPLPGEQLPGNPLEAAELDNVWASGCGQFCTTDGQSACTDSATCAESGEKPDITCTDEGAGDGSCTGSRHIVCGGALEMSGSNCYQPTPEACCPLPNTCVTIHYNWGVGWGVGTACAQGVTPQATDTGVRNLCTIVWNDVGCGYP